MNKNVVWIESSCDNYYRLISKVENLSVKIYEVKYIDKKLYLKVTKKDYEKINKYIISYKFKIIKNTGINKFLDYIKKEKIFINMYKLREKEMLEHGFDLIKIKEVFNKCYK